MKIKLSDYIANFFVENNISNIFTVVGGGAMHLNDSFGNKEGLTCIYNHHEQASAICAEGYAKLSGKPAVVCVTTGPGGTNAITGVLCAWQDSVPMIVISGQVRYATTVESTGLDLRQFGEQEHYIIDTVKSITKYSIMVKDPKMIKYHLQKALYEATTGRCGPCWIDVPLDIQGTMIEEDELIDFTVNEAIQSSDTEIQFIIDEIKKSKAPVLIAGSAIRGANCLDTLYEVVEKLNIPVICPTSICDYYDNSHPLYFGNFGVFGGRVGNFIVQNADLIISLGARLTFKQTGFNFENFSPNSKKIVVDFDENELKKGLFKIHYPVNEDIKDILTSLDKLLEVSLDAKEDWLDYCNTLKSRFAFDIKEYESSNFVNPYYFTDKLLEKIDQNNVTVVGNSCASVSTLQLGISKQGQRIFGNVNCGTMGYDIPGAIGASIAANRPVMCITGDGSFQMNIQELQTVVHNNIPIRFIIYNNSGYKAIVQSQTNFFNGRLSGCTKNSGISMPSFEKIAYAYDIPYLKLDKHSDVENAIDWILNNKSYCLLEIIQDDKQVIEPKVSSKKLEDGQIYSPPIDDLSPFLSEEVYNEFSNYQNWKLRNRSKL